jgi:protein-L-isoaspartate(D-aspartate) O-methyltransferase
VEVDPSRLAVHGTEGAVADGADELREWMVRTQIAARGIRDERVLAAMRAVPRHRFVPSVSLRDAYADRPLSIGSGQTISQPYMVAWMLAQLELQPGQRVLEVGTGCGYAAAVLAELVDQVWTIERHPELAERARLLLTELGYDRVEVVVGDGSRGYAPAAPYDAIVVAAAADEVPDALVDQLADGGRLVLPVDGHRGQELVRLRRRRGRHRQEVLGGVRFVPLVRD